MQVRDRERREGNLNLHCIPVLSQGAGQELLVTAGGWSKVLRAGQKAQREGCDLLNTQARRPMGWVPR